jgi:hypothetical protein
VSARAFFLLAVLAIAAPARAQAGGAAERALEHFRIGLELVDRGAWDSALAEFRRSAELSPRANTLRNAAVCLRELGRFDEALDTYDDILAHRAAELSPAERAQIDADVARLARFVGRLDVRSDPPGASVFVDGRLRGTTPLTRPIRVTVGTRSVRVAEPAFAPFETRVLVASGETERLAAHLVVVSRIGRVRFGGAAGFEVLVDGAVVGVTPWEGSLGAGAHLVRVRNAKDEGSEPRAVEVRTGHTVEIVPEIHRLSGRLRVEPTPGDARVSIDGVVASRGSYVGDVTSGRHEVAVSAPWYETHTQAVWVSSRAAQAVRPVLQPVPRAYADVSAGVVPLFDATAHLASGACTDSCIGMFAALRGGYNVTARVSLELGLLGFTLPQKTSRSYDDTTLGGVTAHAYYTESANAQLIIGAAGVRVRLFDRTPLTLRLTAGPARIGLTTTGLGSYCTDASNVCPSFGHDGVSRVYWGAAIMPEVRFGYRFSTGLSLDAGVGLLLATFPSLAGSTAQLPNGLAGTPPSPSFGGGVAWAIPVSAAFRLEL